jgi:hypothetical protein
MLAAFYKMSGQVRLPKTAFHSGWGRQRSGLRRILAGLFLRFVPGSFGLAAFIDQYCFPGVLVLHPNAPEISSKPYQPECREIFVRG